MTPARAVLGAAGLVLALAAQLGLPGGAQAQGGFLRPDFDEQRPKLPDFEPDQAPPRDLLPIWPTPDPAQDAGPPRDVGPSVLVSTVDIVGNQAVPTDALRTAAAPFLGEVLSHGDLARLQDTLTRVYIDRGFVTSGAKIPPQRVSDGRLRIQIVEGRLEQIQIKNAAGFRERYLRDRVVRDADSIVNVARIEERLQRLQEDDRIDRIDAALVPGSSQGQSRLVLDATANAPIQGRVDISNHQSDEIREANARVRLEHNNLTGWGDRIGIETRLGVGLQEVSLDYEIPINRHDTTLGFDGDYIQSQIQDDLLRSANIESEAWSTSLILRHPLIRTRETTLGLFARAEYRLSKTRIDGEPFSFADGVENGRSTIAALRVGPEYSRRTPRQALALRATFSFGVPVLNATVNGGETPDGRFFHALLQAQLARRLPWLDATLIARGDLQLSSEALLPIEQFALGGYATVRGYTENRLIRDNAMVAAVELRVPIWRRAGRSTLSLGPIADVGYGWNTDRPELGATTLASVGLASRLRLTPWATFDASWSRTLSDRSTRGDPSLQKDGVHVRLRVEF